MDPLSPSFPLSLFSIICGLAFLFVVIMFYGMYRTAQKGRDEFTRAIPASAKIIKIGHSSNLRNYGDVLVHLTFEVMPTNGASYELATEWTIEPASVSKLKEGHTLKIKIDPRNPRRIYSNEKWAQALGQEPLGDKEDGE